MAYEDWSDDFREVWDLSAGGLDEDLEPAQHEWLEYMFEEGFMKSSNEDDYDPASVAYAREEFFDTLGMSDEFFDWEGWREAMGYND